MTKFTFANENMIVVEGYQIGNTLPAKAPTLKAAAQIALSEIAGGITPNSAAVKITANGAFKDIAFQNGALLTIPADYDDCDYKQALEIVVKEIDD